MSDIVDQLRSIGCACEPFTTGQAKCQCNAAADEIERLRSLLRRIDDAMAWETTELGRDRKSVV